MPMWPFGRKKQRSSAPQLSSSSQEHEKTLEKHHYAIHPQNATPRSIAKPVTSAEEIPRKRRRSSGGFDNMIEETEDIGKLREPRSSSREDITALPGSRKLETSPHLRSPTSPAIPYSPRSPTPGTRRVMIEESSPPVVSPKRGKQPNRNSSQNQHRRLSKRQEFVDRAVREEEIRAMSAPVPIPKRQTGHGAQGDILRRDSKNARRTFSKNAGDSRGSNVSLPFADSIRSSMSIVSDQRGWEVSALDFLNPRPNVRLASSTQHNGDKDLSRNGSKKEKMPALTQDKSTRKHKDRRKIAELADELDASDIRVLLERDRRRKDKKTIADQIKLERSLQRRAEKQRLEDERRAEQMGTPPPSAVHPAFRSKSEGKKPAEDATIGQAPPTPTSVYEDDLTTGGPKQNTYLSYGPNKNPFRDPDPNPFDDPPPTTAREPQRIPSPAASPLASPAVESPSMETPMETPMEDPIVETAQAVRLSQNRLSQAVPTPPRSPLPPPNVGQMSPLRREYTPEIPEAAAVVAAPAAASAPRPLLEERQPSDTTTKRAGTWASFFRRGAPTRSVEELPPPNSVVSFSNTSRESMSRQPIPAHLVGAVTKRHSATPARTQSIFREDLPEIANSPRNSKLTSPDQAPVIINAASDNASKRVSATVTAPMNIGRTDSPVDTNARASMNVMSSSFASVDSEASWISRRPSKRHSDHSQMRGSIGSLTRHEEFSASYEDLGMPEDQFFQGLTSNLNALAGETPTGARREGDDTMYRRDTNRRRPILIERDPRVKSREGLLTEYLGSESAGIEDETQDDFEDGHDDHKPHEIVYGRGHARKISTGSAKLLDIPPSRTRSGRNSPDNRLSVAESSTMSPRL